MAKMSKEELARYSGAEWMLRKIEAEGIDAARADLEARNARGIPLALKQTDLDRFCEDEKNNTIATVLLMSVMTLHDEYGFGAERLNRFIQRFNTKTECLADGYVDWQDIHDAIRDETGVDVVLPEVFARKD